MDTSLFVNEIRIPLSNVYRLDIIQCLTTSLSSRHKRVIERFLTENGWISIFEGDVLFLIPKNAANFDDEKQEILNSLDSIHVQNASSLKIKIGKLNQIPQRVIERVIFAVLSYRASKRGIFSTFGRTFFKPTPDANKLSHRTLETTLLIENEYIKIYFSPSYVALMNIDNTYREKLPDIELLALCKYREKSICQLAEDDGSCPFIKPGILGYYDDAIEINTLDDTEKLLLRNRFDGCPKFVDISKVILVKATKKAKKFSVYPPYVVFAGISREDLYSNPKILRSYRDATLMSSSKRWQETIRWIKDIFALQSPDLPRETELNVSSVNLPVQILLSTAIKGSAHQESGYKTILFPDQKIVNNYNNPIPQSYSGGWLFSNQGAYDRDLLTRQFDSIKPYLVVPDLPGISQLSRTLMEIFSDGVYKARSEKGDQDFLGLNRPESKSKYNVQFINPWIEEEGLYLLPNADEITYKNTIQDIKRDWNSSEQKDLNRLAIIITPTSKLEESELYYRLKKTLIEEGIPSQFISINTLRKLNESNSKFGPTLHSLWLNMYSKMGGKPWRLAGEMENVHCFIGIGFGLNKDNERGKHIYAGVAHIFDKFGSWIDIASGSQTISNEEHESFYEPQKYLEGTSSFKISKNVTQEIIYDALRLYQQQQTPTREHPRNIVLHKLGKIYECEVIGFLEGIRQLLGSMENCRMGIVQIEQDHQVKLYGSSSQNQRLNHTVQRGIGLYLGSLKIALATTGYIARSKGAYYSGIGTPQPLLITSILPTSNVLKQYGLDEHQFYDIEALTKHIMALTQLHWGSTKDNIRLPITSLYAQKVADLISKTNAAVNTWESYHRPWFL